MKVRGVGRKANPRCPAPDNHDPRSLKYEPQVLQGSVDNHADGLQCVSFLLVTYFVCVGVLTIRLVNQNTKKLHSRAQVTLQPQNGSPTKGPVASCLGLYTVDDKSPELPIIRNIPSFP